MDFWSVQSSDAIVNCIIIIIIIIIILLLRRVCWCYIWRRSVLCSYWITLRNFFLLELRELLELQELQELQELFQLRALITMHSLFTAL